jgi:hypothetical protein
MYTEKMRESHHKRPPTRRDYELIAAIVKQAKCAHCAKAFAIELGRLPGFDKTRFLRACGVL